MDNSNSDSPNVDPKKTDNAGAYSSEDEALLADTSGIPRTDREPPEERAAETSEDEALLADTSGMPEKSTEPPEEKTAETPEDEALLADTSGTPLPDKDRTPTAGGPLDLNAVATALWQEYLLPRVNASLEEHESQGQWISRHLPAIQEKILDGLKDKLDTLEKLKDGASRLDLEMDEQIRSWPEKENKLRHDLEQTWEKKLGEEISSLKEESGKLGDLWQKEKDQLRDALEQKWEKQIGEEISSLKEESGKLGDLWQREKEQLRDALEQKWDRELVEKTEALQKDIDSVAAMREKVDKTEETLRREFGKLSQYLKSSKEREGHIDQQLKTITDKISPLAAHINQLEQKFQNLGNKLQQSEHKYQEQQRYTEQDLSTRVSGSTFWWTIIMLCFAYLVLLGMVLTKIAR